MTLLACFVLLAASTSVELVDEVYQIPPAEWKYVEVNLRQNPALVIASFRLPSGSDAGAGSASAKVRLALMTRADLERLREGVPHGLLAVTALGKSGELNFRVRQPGDYVLVVDNRANMAQSAAVHLRIALDFAPAPPAITRLDPRRQLTVIVLAFAFFFGVVTFSARQLLLAAKKT